ncbi:MAG: hypothetical protein GY774_04735 [Planctomycetes bacterium]|nr:hypothetical protein [Planctomycetota bacterium]
MAIFTYTAKRGIKTGHSIGNAYSITCELQRQDGGLPIPVKSELVSLSGNVVTTLHRIDRIIALKTTFISIEGDIPDDADFYEFLSSVSGGEVFTFNDGSDQSAMLNSKPTRNRSGLYFTYSFSIRLL